MLNNRFDNHYIIDLLNERHKSMRESLVNTWNNEQQLSISNTEWYILSKAYQNHRTPLSKITKHISISRQAIHKQVKNLEAKQLIVIENVEYNKKEKCVRLTHKGESYYKKYEELKTQLERKITAKIGQEQMNILKKILIKDWGMNDSY